MKVTETKLSGCFIIEPTTYGDSRGYFFESFNEQTFQEHTGTTTRFVQDNQSFSTRGVLRGLHAQRGEHAQAKLVRVLQGRVLDVMVDARPDSPTFGQYETVELSAENNLQVFIPRGFLHGFVVLSDTATFFYKCDNFYHKEAEWGVRYDDPTLAIDWQLSPEELIISDKDQALPFWDAISFKTPRILITGGSGQVGRALQKQLAGENFDTFFLDSKQLPLEQTMIIHDMLGMYEPDIIIHTAAYTAVDKAESEPDRADAINHLASEEIAQYCRLHGAKLLAISTDYVFDGQSSEPLAEDAPTRPLNVYGQTKLKGEQAIQKWAPESIIIRTSWVYAEQGHNFVNTMLRLLREREEVSVVSDQIGSPTYAGDLAQAIVDILKADTWQPGIYHYANEGQVSWYDFAVAIREQIGASCRITPIPTAQYPTPAKRPAYSLLDKSKIKRTFNVEVPFWLDSLKLVIA